MHARTLRSAIDDTVAYDSMRERLTVLTARLARWIDHTARPTDAARAHAEMTSARADTLAVDGYDRAAVDAHTATLDARIGELGHGSVAAEDDSRDSDGAKDDSGVFGPDEGAPRVVLVGGQPGAGKSQATHRIAATHPGIVPLSGDDLRAFHPAFEALLRDRPLEAGPELARATSVWVRTAIDDARGARRSLLLEGTFHTPGLTFDTAAEFTRAGFRTEIVALATPRRDSLMAAIGRYFLDHQSGGEPRWTTLAGHDAGWDGTRRLLADPALPDRVHRVLVMTRFGVAFDSAYDSDSAQESAVEALDRGRSAPPSPAEAARWLDRLDLITQYARACGEFGGEASAMFHEIIRVAVADVIPALPGGGERDDAAAHWSHLAAELAPPTRP